jgi:hypothetical protein
VNTLRDRDQRVHHDTINLTNPILEKRTYCWESLDTDRHRGPKDSDPSDGRDDHTEETAWTSAMEMYVSVR